MKEVIAQLKQSIETRKNEKGATMVEYALMVALIAIVCIGAVTAIGTAASGEFQNIATAL